MRTSRILVSCLLSSLVLSAAPHALAQRKPAPRPPAPAAPEAPPAPKTLADTLTGEAKSDYESAKLLYGDGDFAGALVKFQSAYDRAKDPRLLWNIAACEKSLRHYASVLTYVRQYLKDGESVLSASDKSEAESLIAAIEPFTAALELAVNEPDAKVYVDEKLVGETPLAKPVVVDIGVRKVRVTKDGYEEFAKEVPVGGSPKIHLDAKLEKIIHEGTLVVTARAKDEIFLDGARVGIGSWRGVVSSGGHMLRVAAPEMRPYQAEIFVRDKETRTVAITLDREVKPGGGVPTWVWIGGGAIVAAGAAVGGYFLFQPDDKQPKLPVGTLEPGNVQASFPWIQFR